MRRLRRRFNAGEPSDAGFAMILVIGMATVISLFVIVTVTASQQTLSKSVSHSNFEGGLAAAEAGIDRELSLIQESKNRSPSVDYSSPAPCNVTSLPAASTFTSATAERAWARTEILKYAAFPQCIRTTPAGQFIAFRPAGKNVVYSMGWAPSKASASARPRLLKAEYVFAPYRPTNAVLTTGSIGFQGSVTLNTAPGVVSASIHTNGSVTQLPTSVSVTGALSAAGSVPSCTGNNISGGCTGSSAPQQVPDANPSNVYNTFAPNLIPSTSSSPLKWVDLCPDGTARAASLSGPCTGAVRGTNSDGNGWAFSVANAGGSAMPTWTLNPYKVPYPPPDLVAYGYGVNLVLDGAGGNPGIPIPYTILAEGAPSTDLRVSSYTGSAICGRVGGDVTVKQVSIVPSVLVPGLGIMATGNIDLSTQASIGALGNGALVMAGNDVTSQAAGTTNIVGSVVANNQCTSSGRGSNSIQGWTITYDQTAELPVSSLINTTLWLEYPS